MTRRHLKRSARRTTITAVLAATLSVAIAASSTAQEVAPEPASGAEATDTPLLHHRVGIVPRIGLVNGFGDGSDGGFGVEATGGVRLGDSPVWIRGDVSFHDLGETLRGSGAATSGNSLVTLVAGPEVESRRGAVRPFAHIVAGLVLSMPRGDASAAESNGNGLLGLGGGVRVALSSGPRSALLEAGLRFAQTGELTFALGEDTDTAAVKMYELRLGLLLGLP